MTKLQQKNLPRASIEGALSVPPGEGIALGRIASRSVVQPLSTDPKFHELLKFYVGRFAQATQWYRFAESGGLKFPSNNPGSINALSPKKQMQHLILVPHLLDELRVLGPVVDELRDCGARMKHVGVRPLEDASYETHAQRKENTRFQSVSLGIKLLDGSTLVIPDELQERIAAIHAALYHCTRWLTQFSPNPELRLAKQDSASEAARASAVDRAQAYTVAYFLGSLSDGQYGVWRTKVFQQPTGTPSLLEALTPHELGLAATTLFAKGWFFRKSVEPGGTSHPSFEQYQQYRLLPDRERLFVPLINIGHLRDMTLMGSRSLLLLASAGKAIREGAPNLDAGELVEPLGGVPLHVPYRGKSRVTIAADLLDDRAFTRHMRWCLTRRICASIPDGTLRPLPRAEDVAWNPESERSPRVWNPDRINAYGDAIALSFIREKYPDMWRKMLVIARRPAN